MAKFILLLLGAGLVYDLYAFPWYVWFQQIGVLFWPYVLYALVRFLFTGPRLLYLVKGIVVGFVGLIVLMIGVGFDPSVDTRNGTAYACWNMMDISWTACAMEKGISTISRWHLPSARLQQQPRSPFIAENFTKGKKTESSLCTAKARLRKKRMRKASL